MKWLFRIIGLILTLFVGLCIAGAFLPAMQRVETMVSLPVEAEDIYYMMSDLQTYPEWSGVGGPDSEWVYGGADEGVGQTAAWQAGDQVGSLEILQTAPGEFVRVRVIGPMGERTVTLALTEEAETTAFLLQSERQLGGFPYFGRLAGLRQKAVTKAALEDAAKGMSDLLR